MMPLFFFLFFLLMVIYALLIAYYHAAWNRLPSFELSPNQASVFISVIIAARNEEKNIQALLQSLEAQQYPKEYYEVIIIDDHSTDATWSLLQAMSFAQMQVKFIRLGEHIDNSQVIASYKKKAIE